MHFVMKPVMILLRIKSVFQNSRRLVEPEFTQSLNIPYCTSLGLKHSLENARNISEVESIVEL